MKNKSCYGKLNIKIIIVFAILIMSFFAVRVVMAASVLLKAEYNEGNNYINCHGMHQTQLINGHIDCIKKQKEKQNLKQFLQNITSLLKF